MPKNPFINCKSRKRKRTTVVVKSEPKRYCPRSMVRYDDVPNEYKTLFVCKKCLACVLSEDALNSHLIKCKYEFTETETVTNVEKLHYNCEICNRVFSRKVTLTRHKELHEKTVNYMDSDESDEIEFITRPKKPNLRENKFVMYNDDTNTFFIDDEF